MFLERNFFMGHNRHKFSTNRDGLSCNTSGSQLGLLLLRLGHETIAQQQIQAETKTSQTILRQHSVPGTIIGSFLKNCKPSLGSHLHINESSLWKNYGERTTKRNPILQHYRNLKIFYEIKWREPSVRTYNEQRKKCFNQQKKLRFLIKEI